MVTSESVAAYRVRIDDDAAAAFEVFVGARFARCVTAYERRPSPDPRASWRQS
jgi:hypothetical protein